MKICSNCGASFEDEAMFCTECGSPLNENGAKEAEPFVVDDDDESGTSILDDDDDEFGTSILEDDVDDEIGTSILDDDEETEFEVEDEAEAEKEVETENAENESEEFDFDVDDEEDEVVEEEIKEEIEEEAEAEEDVPQTEYFDDSKETEEDEYFEIEVEEEKPEPKPEVKPDPVVAKPIIDKKPENIKPASVKSKDTMPEKPKKKKNKAGIIVGAIILVIVVVLGILFAIPDIRDAILDPFYASPGDDSGYADVVEPEDPTYNSLERKYIFEITESEDYYMPSENCRIEVEDGKPVLRGEIYPNVAFGEDAIVECEISREDGSIVSWGECWTNEFAVTVDNLVPGSYLLFISLTEDDELKAYTNIYFDYSVE